MNSIRRGATIALNHFRSQIGRKITGPIDGQEMVLDGLVIDSARITNCRLHYGGGDLKMTNSVIKDCKIIYFGAAENAMILFAISSASEAKP